MTQTDLLKRIEKTRERVVSAAQRSGRDASAITILGACKQVERDRVMQAIALGINHVGENQVQEAEAKFKGLERPSQLTALHLIGHLQTNKVRRAVTLFDTIQSVDSIRLAYRIDSIAHELNMCPRIYIQVNLGDESGKDGVSHDGVIELAESVSHCESLSLVGLMAVPPHIEDLELVRPYFRTLRDLRDSVCKLAYYRGTTLELSMGMTQDFEVAIEEGATIVRLGSAIWGPRTT